MHNTFTKITLLLLLLATLFGQAGAFVVSAVCDEPGKISTELAHTPHSPADVQDRDPHLNESDECCDDHCCKAGCVCIGNTCSGTVYLTHTISFPQGIPAAAAFTPSMTTSPFSLAAVLYRPPILTS